jgi:renalase
MVYMGECAVQAIVEDYWASSGLELQVRRPLERLDLAGPEWAAEDGAGRKEGFDCVVTTLPVPQLLGTPPSPEGTILGNFLQIIEADQALSAGLRSVRYNSVFCLGVFYDSALARGLGLRWTYRYFPSDPVIRYIAIDNAKRGDLSSPTCLTVQSHVGWAEEHLARSKRDMAPQLLAALRRLLPSLPPPAAVLPHKWRYSQTSRPFPGVPGAMLLHANPPFIAAGDSFSHSNLDGCLTSASAARRLINEALGI